MQLIFRTRRLERAYRDPGRAARLWGADVGRQYGIRLGRIQAAQDWARLTTFRTFDLHPLHGPRRGEYAIRLTGRWRLIVERGDSEGSIVIVGVEDYHG